MAKLKWVLLCERALFEAGSNALSVISMIEEVTIQGEPPPPSSKNRMMIPHRFAVVQFWQRSDADESEVVQTRSRLLNPQGKVFAMSTQKLDLTAAKGMRVVTNALGFPWFGEGDYGIEIQLFTEKGKWKTVGREQFTVKIAPKPASLQ